jgi:rhodanese-related sulfurtransferase
MNGQQASISASELYARIGTAAAPLIVDVRRPAAFDTADNLIAGAFHCLPENVAQWQADLPRARPVVVYCVHGHEVSQRVAAELRARGFAASFLQGGITAWASAGLPTQRKLAAPARRWITRERPKIDRIACPWLIARFIDPRSEFLYVPASDVIAAAKRLSATPYDIDGVEFTHDGPYCSFDTILKIYGIKDPALDHVATIVRGADTSRHDLAPQCAGLFAISLGLSANFHDDHEMLAHGMVIYDALYTWCRSLQRETHNWPPAAQPNGQDRADDPTNFRKHPHATSAAASSHDGEAGTA